MSGLRDFCALVRFIRAGGGRIELSADAKAVLLHHRQLEHACEAGGVLLGRLILGGADMVIDEVTVPDRRDRRRRFSFYRARGPAQGNVDRAWNRSGGTRIYLGEWHTHPEDDPTPSSRDLRDWRRLTRKNRYEQEFLLFLIVGRVRIRIWELPRLLPRGAPFEAWHVG